VYAVCIGQSMLRVACRTKHSELCMFWSPTIPLKQVTNKRKIVPKFASVVVVTAYYVLFEVL
jgi:hypothetical protein